MSFREEHFKAETERNAALQKALDALLAERSAAIAKAETAFQEARAKLLADDAKASAAAGAAFIAACEKEVDDLVKSQNAAVGLGPDGKALPAQAAAARRGFF